MNWRNVALAAWNGYTAALAMVWGPFVAILTFIRTWAILIVPILVLYFAGGMGLMVISAWAEMWFIALLGLAVAFPASLLLAALIWIHVVRLRIGIDLLQIPAGEIMEVLRETGQLVKLQDPKVRDGEGNIRLFDSAQIMTVGKRAFCLPAWVLTMGLWLVAFPHIVTLASLGAIGGGGLAAAFWLRQRGRKVGLGFDFLAGAMIHFIFGGVGTILFRSLLGQWWGVLAGAISGNAVHAPAAVGLDGLLANVWYRLFHGWITWYVPAREGVLAQWPHTGDIVGLVIGTLLLVGFIGFHVVVITAIVRFLKEPPEGAALSVVKSSDPGIFVVGTKVLGTAGRGDSGFPGLSMNGWLLSAIGFGVLAAIVWLVNRYGTGEYTCRFGDPFFTFVLALVVVGIVAGLLKQVWPRAASALGALALVCVLFGFTYDALEHWGGRQTACAVDESPAAPTATVPAHRTYEPPPPPRRSSPYEPRPSGDGRIATYFASNGAQCPDAARRSGWESLRDAQASCRSESWLARNADWR